MMRFSLVGTVRVFLPLFLCLSLLVSLPQAQENPPPAEPQDEVIRIDTELVQTDVMVFDKQGRFVEGLKPEQFELRVDGRAQAISFFEMVTAGGVDEGLKIAAARVGQSSPRPKSGADARALDRGRTIFFFIDDLHLSPGSVTRTRETLLRFIDQDMGVNDQVALTTASGQLGFLQQLTDNRSVLREAVKKITYRPFKAGDVSNTAPMTEYHALAIEKNERDVLDYFADKQAEELCVARGARPNCAPPSTGMTNNAVFDGSPGRVSRGRASGGGAGGVSIRVEAERMVKQRARAIVHYSTHITRNMLSSLESLIQRASLLPERKLIIFISDGFFVNYLKSSETYDLRRVIDAAARSGSVIYTVDARGLVAGNTDASVSHGFDLRARLVSANVREVTAAQEPLHMLAEDTGGRAWINSNALNPGIVRAVKETSSYYLLAWRPESAAQRSDKFRQIEVSIKGRPDLTVRMRRGFFGEATPSDVKSGAAGATSAKPKTPNEELLALMRSSYPKRGLPISLAAGYVSYLSSMGLIASMQVETEAIRQNTENKQNAEVDVMGTLVDDTGKVLSSFQQHLTATPAQPDQVIYTQQFSLTPGLYQLRVAARDRRSGRTGSVMEWVEIPNIPQGNLALSSIFLSAPGASNAANGAGQPQSAPLDPDRHFPRTSRMRFQAQIYNAARTPTVPPELTLEVQLLRGGQPVITAPPSPVPTAGATDLARIPIAAEIDLQVLPAGRYTLQITIADRIAKTSASQRVNFTVE